MSFKRKDLEIAYSLRWKNGPKKDEEISIISVYDIPATTLNFEVFKSYLLKNSGTSEHDVKVSYLMDNGKEYTVQSQTDFQVALYAFRRKARSGEIINLMLEKISDFPLHKNMRHSNDVETQFENMEPNSIVSTCCNAVDTPPEWFVSCMTQMKKEVVEELTATVSSVVSSALSTLKPQIVSQPPCHHHSRKSKPDNKRMRKLAPHLSESNTDAKELIKTLKLDNKLERLERKASKYREKRMALQGAPKSSDSEAGASSSRSRSLEKGVKSEEVGPKMDAKPVNCQSVVPHMLGGEIYLHQWEVENTGEAPWSSKTHLQYTWGSKSLLPLNKCISVPFLKPGERGTISVRLQIPSEMGKYECYWQFLHKGRRFGHWLGCQVIVDPFDLKGNSSVLATTSTPNTETGGAAAVSEDLLLEPPTRKSVSLTNAEALASMYKSMKDEAAKHEQLMQEVSENIDKINLHEGLDSDSHCSLYDYDSLLDGDSSSRNSFRDEFVVVPVPKCFTVDQNIGVDEPKPNPEPEQAAGTLGAGSQQKKRSPGKILNASDNNFDDNNNTESVSGGSSGNSIKLKDEDLDNIVVITLPKDDQVKEGFIYVHVDGQKVLLPKNILKSEVVNAAQELEKSPNSANSVGVIVESMEGLNQTPTPSIASTITRETVRRPGPPTENENAGNTTDSAVPVLETAAAPPKQDNIAIDMTMSSFKEDDPIDPSNYFEANNYMSHCSAAGSCFSEVNNESERSKRLFIFPQHVPGYEVVHPVLDMNNPLIPELTNEASVPPTANPFVEHVPNYQQTPPEQRAVPVTPTAPTDPLSASQEAFRNFFGSPTPNASTRGGVNQTAGGASHSEGAASRAEGRADQGAGVANGDTPPVHILPETLVSGAVNAASSAINTARSVITNMMNPQPPGRWINGHWVSTSPETPREANLQALAEMGFWNRDLNATLLARFNDDLNRVVAELVQ